MAIIDTTIATFQYVVADIIFYSKSLGWAQTVEFWLKTSSQSAMRDLQYYRNYPKGNNYLSFVQPDPDHAAMRLGREMD